MPWLAWANQGIAVFHSPRIYSLSAKKKKKTVVGRVKQLMPEQLKIPEVMSSYTKACGCQDSRTSILMPKSATEMVHRSNGMH